MAGEPVSIDVAAHEKLMDEWALAIGRFMVAFSSCEYWTYLFIETFGSKRLRESTTDLQLKARAPLAKSLVLDIGLTPEMTARVEKAFGAIGALAVTRNLVAHNGPMLHACRTDEGKIQLEIELRSAKDDGKDITIKRIEERTSEAKTLDEELMLLYGAVRQPQNRLKK